MKFKFEMTEHEDDSDYSLPKEYVKIESEMENLYEVLDKFENFLKGCGFVFKGNVVIEEEEEEEEQYNFVKSCNGNCKCQSK